MPKRMSMTEARKMFEDFDKLAIEEQKMNALERRQATGLMVPAQMQKKYARDKALVLSYGKKGAQITYSPAQLRAFLNVVKTRTKQYNNNIQGVTITQLLRNSLAIDKQRANMVRNATLYQFKGNILYFRVTGNSKPFYRVQIRLDDLNIADSTKSPLEAARAALKGNISIECPCGRHQYWYRYLATLGRYEIAPTENAFPKIRNPSLRGCCCKHVLKVIQVLTSNKSLVLLTKMIEKQQGKASTGYGGRKTLLSGNDLKQSLQKRMSRATSQALKQYEQQLAILKQKIKTRKKLGDAGNITKEQSRNLANEIKALITGAKLAGYSINRGLQNLAKTKGISFADLKAYMKLKNIEVPE